MLVCVTYIWNIPRTNFMNMFIKSLRAKWIFLGEPMGSLDME